MKEIKFLDNYVIFSPKKGIKKYFTFSFYASCVILCICFLIFMFIFKNYFEYSRHILSVLIAVTEILLCIVEMIYTAINKTALATDSFFLARFLKTVPNIKSVLRKALICDEIRKTSLCYLGSFILMLIAFIFGIYPINRLLLCFFYITAVMNLTVTIGNYANERTKIINVNTRFVILSVLIAVSITLFTVTVPILSNEYTGYTVLILIVFTVLMNLLSLITGIICFRKVKKYAMGGIIND